jgi:hypothetical protein
MGGTALCAVGATVLESIGVPDWLAWPLFFAALLTGWWALHRKNQRYRCHTCHSTGRYKSSSEQAHPGDA